MDIGVKGRRAIVCGGSRGISRAAARRLSLEGAEILLVARTAETLASTARLISDESGNPVHYFAADLAVEEGRRALLQSHPAADILVTNAGVPQRSIAYDLLTREDWLGWFDAHFFSAVDLIHGYAPSMVQRRFGRIVNISASFIKFPQVDVGHSHSARLALAGAIASLVRKVAPYNVTINSILPGFVDTDALRAALSELARARKVDLAAVEAEMMARCPANRFATPAEVGDLVAMLCADQMGYVTGQNLINDGGVYQGLF